MYSSRISWLRGLRLLASISWFSPSWLFYLVSTRQRSFGPQIISPKPSFSIAYTRWSLWRYLGSRLGNTSPQSLASASLQQFTSWLMYQYSHRLLYMHLSPPTSWRCISCIGRTRSTCLRRITRRLCSTRQLNARFARSKLSASSRSWCTIGSYPSRWPLTCPLTISNGKICLRSTRSSASRKQRMSMKTRLCSVVLTPKKFWRRAAVIQTMRFLMRNWNYLSRPLPH